MGRLINSLEGVLHKFGRITLLKCMSALGILASSFYISVMYDIAEFGEYSFVMVVSGLVLVVSRMGAEYTCFKFFLHDYRLDKNKAFKGLQIVIVNSFAIAVLLLLLIFLLIDIPERLVAILIMHTLIFSIIQPFSFALRAVERFTLAYLFEAGTFLLMITLFWALFKAVLGISYEYSSPLFYLLYLMVFIYKARGMFNLSHINLKEQVSTITRSVTFLSYTLAEYICFWGVLLASGFFLGEAETGIVSWGTRVFQLFVFVVGIRNSIEVPRILKEKDVRGSLRASIARNMSVSMALMIPFILAILLYAFSFFEVVWENVVIMLLFFYVAAVVRLYFGPICHVFTSIGEKHLIFNNLLVVILTSVVGLVFIYLYGFPAVGPSYLLTWIATLSFSHYSIFKPGIYNESTH